MIISPLGTLSSFAQACRPHQWAKNLLLLAPLLMAHKVTDFGLVIKAVYSLVSFSLAASGVYLLNDWFDLAADREHPRKSKRPLASGNLTTTSALLFALFLLIGSGLIALLFLPPAFLAALALYFALSILYSARLKQVVVLDVLILAALYTLRVIAGAAAVTVPVSAWFLAFSMFLFLSLAFLKRYAELCAAESTASVGHNRRGYVVADLALLRSIGPASGYISVQVLALYIHSSDVIALYRQPKFLWLVGPCVLYWITRVWLIAHRGEMNEDPILFAVKDLTSYIVGLVIAVIISLATLI